MATPAWTNAQRAAFFGTPAQGVSSFNPFGSGGPAQQFGGPSESSKAAAGSTWAGLGKLEQAPAAMGQAYAPAPAWTNAQRASFFGTAQPAQPFGGPSESSKAAAGSTWAGLGQFAQGKKRSRKQRGGQKKSRKHRRSTRRN